MGRGTLAALTIFCSILAGLLHGLTLLRQRHAQIPLEPRGVPASLGTVNETLHFSAWHAWTCAAVLLLICEVLTADFLPTTFAIACGAAALVGATGHGTANQLVAFSVTLLVVLIFVRPVARRSLYHTSDKRLLNAAAIVGQTGTMVEPIAGAGATGRVKLGGEVWRAVCTKGNCLPEGTPVRVTAVDSSTVDVTPV